MLLQQQPIVKTYDWGMYIGGGNEKVAELWWKGSTFLLKMIFVGQPLSLQVHPSHSQLSLHLFPDPHPKPEILIATTHFEALCGFLDEPFTKDIPSLHPYPTLWSVFNECPLPPHELLHSVQSCLPPSHPCSTLFLHLVKLYPNDLACLAPFYMHHVRLAPREALVIPSSQPHCYLNGQGVECMPLSDNISRCGLTSKECNPNVFFSLCHSQPPIIQKHPPFHHPELDTYFSIHTGSLIVGKSGSILLDPCQQKAWSVSGKLSCGWDGTFLVSSTARHS